jgi:uncharacterized membrane protein
MESLIGKVPEPLVRGCALSAPQRRPTLRDTQLIEISTTMQHAGNTIAKTIEEVTAKNVKSIADLDRAAQTDIPISDRVANRITGFCGSMAFFWVHVIWFTLWIVGNTMLLSHPIDPFPFSFLTLVVSLEAIFLSTFILISENRQARLSERRSHLDLQINLLAEQEATKVLMLLSDIARKLGVNPKKDPDTVTLEQPTRVDAMAEQIDQSLKEEKNERPDTAGKKSERRKER